MKSRILWLVACVAVSFIGLAGANPSILWEDFEDENGNGAFDPAFIHTVGYWDDGSGKPLHWDIHDFRLPSMALSLYHGTDYITFDLDDGQFVSHISVNVYDSIDSTIVFFGTDGNTAHNPLGIGWNIYEADVTEIGEIQAVQFFTREGKIDDIKLTVMPVPEPTTWMLFVLGVAVVFSTKGRRDRKDLFRAFRVFRG